MGVKQGKTDTDIADARQDDGRAAISAFLESRRQSPGYAQRVAKLRALVARTICPHRPSATLDTEDVDLVVGPSEPDPEADELLRRELARRKQLPGYAQRVARLHAVVQKTLSDDKTTTNKYRA